MTSLLGCIVVYCGAFLCVNEKKLRQYLSCEQLGKGKLYVKTYRNKPKDGEYVSVKEFCAFCMNASGGAIKFNCSIAENQYLLYSFDGKAELTNKNFATIENVEVMGKAALAKGTSAVAFSCEHDKYETPEVSVRFITKGEPDKITSE